MNDNDFNKEITEQQVEETSDQQTEEVVEKKIEIEIEKQNQNEINFDKELSGLPKELVELVKSIENPSDREKTIKLAKEQRAREDRLHLENGNLKKEKDNISGLLQNLETRPAETIKYLIKELNLDPNSFSETVDDDNYTTVEELTKKQIQDIEKKSKQSIQEEINQRESKELLEELFSDEKYNEDFVIKNQFMFIQLYNQELEKNGLKTYYSKKSRLEAMKIAAEKLERLNPDYETKLENKIRQQIENERKNKFDEAKKQQKISKSLSNSDKPFTDDEKLREMVRQYMQQFT